MENKNLYIGLGVLAVAGLAFGIYAHNKKNKLPDATKIKVGADGSSDEVRGVIEKLPSQKEEQEVSNAHGGGGHGGHGGRGRFWGGGWGGYGYPYWGGYNESLCYKRDAVGNIVATFCDYDYPY